MYKIRNIAVPFFLIFLCIAFFSEAIASSVTSGGVKRYQTSSQYTSFYGGIDVPDYGNVYQSDYGYGFIAHVAGASDGEYFYARVIKSTGKVSDAGGFQYTLNSDDVSCWSGDCQEYYDNSIDIRWHDLMPEYAEDGVYTMEVYSSLTGLIFTRYFTFIPHTLNYIAGDAQEVPLHGYSSNALLAQVLQAETGEPISDQSVTFRVVSAPDGAGIALTPFSSGASSVLSIRTDSDGYVKVLIQSGGVTGPITVEATGGYTGKYKATFTASIIDAPYKPEDVLPPELDIGKNLGGGSCGDLYAGDPINVLTSNSFQQEHDYKSLSPFPLEITRYYNSRATRKTVFGNTWSHTYDRSISHSTIGKGKNVQEKITLYRQDGSFYEFLKTNNLWVADSNVKIKLADIASGWRVTRADDFVEEYDEAGKLVKLINPEGFYQTITYNEYDVIAQVADQFGRVLTYNYIVEKSKGSQTVTLDNIVTPNGDTYTYYIYDNSDGTLTWLGAADYPDGSIRFYNGDDPAYPYIALTGIRIEVGSLFDRSWEKPKQKVRWGYDAYMRPTYSEVLGEGRYTFDYHPYDSATQRGKVTITNPQGVVSDYTYTIIEGKARMLSAGGKDSVLCDGKNKDIEYTSTGKIAQRTDFEGYVTTYTYNSRELQTSKTVAKGTEFEHTTTTQWHPTLNKPIEIIDGDLKTTYIYNERGQVLEKSLTDLVSGSIRRWHYGYTSDGLLESEDGPRTDVMDITTYQYDLQGNVASMTNALNHITLWGDYNGDGRPGSMTENNGLVTTFTYDPMGRVSEKVIGSETYQYTYYPESDRLWTIKTLPNNATYRFTYDETYRLVEIAKPDKESIKYEYDAYGNISKTTLWRASTKTGETTNLYDELGQLATHLGAYAGEETHYEYGPRGDLAKVIDPLSQTMTNRYDPLGRLASVVDKGEGVTTYQYDHANNLIQITAPNQAVTQYRYNAFGDLLSESSADRGMTNYAYDEAGNLTIKQTANGDVITYRYDALNRLVEQTVNGLADIQSTYDATLLETGRVSTISNRNARLDYDYHPRGHITARRLDIGGTLLTLDRAYSANSELLAQRYPSGHLIERVYQQGNLNHLTLDGARVLTVLSLGDQWYWRWGNVYPFMTYQRAHNLNGWVANFTLADETQTLTYDLAGRIIAISGLNGYVGYLYDAMSRLTYADNGSQFHAYEYDTNGNRISDTRTNGQNLYSYGWQNNQLMTMTGNDNRQYHYDANGNILSDGNNSFTFNALGQLTDYNGYQYFYNGEGQRVKKVSPSGETTHFYYDESGKLLGVYDDNGGLIQEYVYLNQTPIAVIQPEGYYYITTDHLDTPRAVMDANYNIIWRWESEPFGQVQPQEDPDGDGESFTLNLRFPGQYYDAESGLYYNYYRYYDPATGRYVTSDPIGLNGGLNTYLYANANPLSYVDPTGESAVTTVLPVAGAAAASDGPLPIGDVVAAAIVVGAAIYDACSDEDDEPHCSMASRYQIDQAGITDAHDFKRDYVGGSLSRYDICACEDGSIKIAGRGQCGTSGPKIDTWARWK